MKIIVGLGNPGIRYRMSRHNIGFQVVDRLAQISHLSLHTKRFKSLYGTGRIDSQQVILAKPITYMNRSGEAVKKATDFFQLGVEDLVVVHDDMDLPFGTLRFKRRGGDGGHQGLRSIIELTGENNFLRLKVGIGRPPQGMDPAEYVLKTFDKIEQDHLDLTLSQAAESLRVMLSEGLEMAMNQFQKKPRLPSLKL
ncbi:MAG TPA: aminoacyl-tRNA hydrolase [Thermodesulfobacteriota bacterium]|nr:aminoacyl-tRNA hydrolase [Thermodesulfobacteriota bacterium]